jgi:hypothetical protein
MHQKVNNVKELLNRMLNLSHKSFVEGNMVKIEKLLQLNNYPKKLYSGIIKCKTVKPSLITTNFPTQSDEPKTICRFPNIPGLSSRIKNVFKQMLGLKIVLYNINTTKTFFTKLKDKEPIDNISEVIYQIQCKGEQCEKIYIGQTKQRIKARLSQHSRDCRYDVQPYKTALAEHHFSQKHDFDFENAKILEIEPRWRMRNLAEMIHIKLNNDRTINYRQDTCGLSIIYNNLLYTYKNKKTE